MRPLTYFAFTLLSVVIQFCVMDFIQEKVDVDENPIAYNESLDKHSMDMLKDDEPNTLALYYRSNRNSYEKVTGTKYPNTSLRNVSISTSTEVAFTVLDVLYDENLTTTDITFTTDITSSTELDNVTDITLFEQTSTTTRPTTGTKKTKPGNFCFCNLIYKQCDINCCCDEECSLIDIELFDECNNFWQHKKHPLACGESSTSNGFGNLLCIAKTNLPDQRVAEKPKNCSSLYCTNWTIIYCDQDVCVPYNKSLHSPICTERLCINIALKIKYIFNIYDSKIVNAIIKLYAQKITTTQYVMQEIGVKFVIGNASSDRVVTLSGNPGYIVGLPIITSFTEANHSDNFYNSSNENNYLSYAENKGGICVLTKLTKKILQFGINKRSKCRIILRQTSTTNGTEACINIQKDINKMSGVNRGIKFSPYGNPVNLKDDDWLLLKLEHRFIYGEFQSKRSKLQCLNMCTRFAFVFSYADLSEMGTENKLLGVNVDVSPSNVTFECEEYTTVITVDINFINMKSATRRDLAPPPHLNLNLPRDFFFPFPSNRRVEPCNTGLSFSQQYEFDMRW
ncbi:Tectonic-1 [Papilio machaon]|uniref:Tectonic-1 n=1 Tax=Papilio machaon TaxID=76193 RepID=A0A194RBB4_PAPMA|nr:Tectonic-1 [Papilio machaon]